MKNTRGNLWNAVGLALCLAATFGTNAGAQCLLHQYYPLHQGDVLFYDGPLGTGSMSTSQGTTANDFLVTETFEDTISYYAYDGNRLLLTGGKSGWTKLSFNPGIVALDENIIRNGGQVTTRSSATVRSVTVSLTAVVTVAKAGTVTVPAGTFQNCLTLKLTVTGSIPGQGSGTIQAYSYILAPGVGPIKVAVYDGDFALQGWESLTGGTVGGISAAQLAANSGVIAPMFTLQPKATKATNGLNVTLRAGAIPAGVVDYYWFKDGGALVNDGRISGATSSNLTFSPVAMGDQGTYSVMISNAICSATSTGAVLTVSPDLLKPTNSIRSPAPNAVVSNALVQVAGRAGDNVGISRVMVWTLGQTAVQAAGATNWSCLVQLVPGTNFVCAQAFDFEGNASTVATNRVTYVLSDRLTLMIDPPAGGTVTGVSNGQMLAIGRTYKAVAAPRAASGFVFRTWTQTTNNTDWATSTVPELKFTMQSNLVLVATFADGQRPSLTITNPLPKQRLSNGVVDIRGAAKDNDRIANVWVSLNGKEFAPAATGNQWSNWVRAKQDLVPGTNRILAYAADAAGNLSATSQVSCYYVVLSRLTLLTNGSGAIARKFTNNWLEVGQYYTITAVPKPGHLFSNWTDAAGNDLGSNSNRWFKMESNLVLVANFVPNPFLTLKGDYSGLFYPETDPVTVTNSGFMTLAMTDKGAFTGKLLVKGTNLSLTGSFNLKGHAEVMAQLGSSPKWVVDPIWIALDLRWDTQEIAGTARSLEWGSQVLMRRAATGSSNAFAGTYTMVVKGSADAPDSLPGDSPISIAVSPSGALKMSGTLADGSPIGQSVGLTLEGLWPLYSAFNNGKAAVLGWVSLQSNAVGQMVCWTKPGPPKDRFYPADFNGYQNIEVQKYRPPAKGQSAFTWTYGQLDIGGGTLPAPLTAFLEISNNQFVVWSGNISNLTSSLTVSNGQFSGSFRPPGAKTNTTFKATLMQALDGSPQTWGGGWFLGTNQAGWVKLSQSTNQPPPDWAPKTLAGQNWRIQFDDFTTRLFYSATQGASTWTSFDGSAAGGDSFTYTYQKTGPNVAQFNATILASSKVYTVKSTLNFKSATEIYLIGTGTKDGRTEVVERDVTILTRNASNAPSSLVGQRWLSQTIPTGSKSHLFFSTSSNVHNSDGDGEHDLTYSYVRNGNNQATLTATVGGKSGSLKLIFVTQGTAYITGTAPDGSTGPWYWKRE